MLLILLAALHAAPPNNRDAARVIREVAGSAEYLRGVPKKFGKLVKVDGGKVTVRFDKEKADSTWPLIDDAEVKVNGWWGRASQIKPGTRVWAWMKTDRKNRPVAIAMLADDESQKDVHGTLKDGDKPAFEKAREAQRLWLRGAWLKDGVPGSVAFVHVFSGEMDILVDHEAMRWARWLQKGDKVRLTEDPPVDAVVKASTPWRERTLLRLVAKPRDLTDLKAGRRLGLKMAAPPPSVEADRLPPDMDRPRGQPERVEWFLASVYCTCGVRGDTCTGMFYTLASCNPNGCGQPNMVRKKLEKLIGEKLTDRQIMERLLKDEGPGLLQPHLLP